MPEITETTIIDTRHPDLLENSSPQKKNSPLFSTKSETVKKADTEIHPLAGNIKENGNERTDKKEDVKKEEKAHEHSSLNEVTSKLKNLTAPEEKEDAPIAKLEAMAKSLLAGPDVLANARTSNAWSNITSELQPSDLREYRVDIGGQDTKNDRFTITSVPGLTKNERCIMISYLNPNTKRAHQLDKWIVLRYKDDFPTPVAITTGKVDETHYKDKSNRKWLKQTWINTWNENMERLVNYTSWEQLKPEEINDMLSKFKHAQNINIRIPKKHANPIVFPVSHGRLELHEALMGNNPYLITNWKHTKYELENTIHSLFALLIQDIWLAITNPFEWLNLSWKEAQDKMDKYLKLHPSRTNRKMRAEEQTLSQNI